MKRIILILIMLVGFRGLWAQNGDTTKIKLGDTKVIIIDKNKDSEEQKQKIEQARQEFERLLEEKQKGLEEQQKLLEEQQKKFDEQQKKIDGELDEQVKKDSELKMKEINKEEDLIHKKIEDLNKEVKALEKGIEDLENKNDEDFGADDDADKDWKNKKFDWDFDKKWEGDWDHISPFRHKDKFSGHWAGFSLGLNSYVNADRKLSLDNSNVGFELDGGRSWVFNLNFLEFNIPFSRYSGITTGLGTSWNNYSFRNNVNFGKNVDGIMVATPEDVKSYNRNSIHTWSFTVPIMLEFQIPKKKYEGVYVGFGIYGSAKVASWGTLEYKLDGVKYEEKRKSDFLMNNLSYGLIAQLGLKYIKLFANYNFVPLFEKDKGPELYPVSIGLLLLSF